MNTSNLCGIAGDWHVDTSWALMALESYARAGVKHILHVGDFGFWPGEYGDSYLQAIEKELQANGQTLYVTLGNHEDYARVAAYAPHPVMPGHRWNPEQPSILVADRGARWEWSGLRFASVGGAASINYEDLTQGVNWWPEERITMGDVYRATADGVTDVLISHDAAQGVELFGSHRTDEKRWSENGLAYATQSRDSMRAVVDGLKPKLAFHGHYHIYKDQMVELQDDAGERYSYRNVSLQMNRNQNNMAVLELSTLQVTMLQMPTQN